MGPHEEHMNALLHFKHAQNDQKCAPKRFLAKPKYPRIHSGCQPVARIKISFEFWYFFQ